MLAGKIAYVDLSKGTVHQEPIPLEWRGKYLGARGINNHLLYRMVDASMDPLGPDNTLILGVGLLTGAPGFGTARFNICALSPESGNVGDSNIGGHFAPELRGAGFDHLVIRGQSPEPVSLFVSRGRIEIRPANHLWGKDTWETQQELKKEHRDERVRAIVIGPAGEHLVRTANVMTGPKDAAGRTGMGAVMGSKRLKAIAVRGSRDVVVAHPQELLRYYQEQMERLMKRGFVKTLSQQGTPSLVPWRNQTGFVSPWNGQRPPLGERGETLYPDKLEQHSVGMAACRGCPVHCRHRFHLKEGKYAGTRGEGPEYGTIIPFGLNQEILDFDTVIYIGHLCDRLGLDVCGTGAMVGWAMELYQRGIIDESVTQRPLKWGDADAVIALLVDIAHRKGFGDVLADAAFAPKRLPAEADEYLLRIRNNVVGEFEGRTTLGWVLSQAVCTLPGWIHRNRPSLEAMGLPRDVLEGLYGGPVSDSLHAYEGKARMVWWHELLNAVCDGLGCCRFQSAMNSPNGPKFEEYSRLVQLATGLDISPEDLKVSAERIYATERLLLEKLGLGGRANDTLPDRWFHEPVAGWGDRWYPVDRRGLDVFLDEYYTIHGWDEQGHPTSESLSRLGIQG